MIGSSHVIQGRGTAIF
ncbi:unnamed protein product, partial [Cuscuta campestris]